ncbi:HTH domain-containing protein [Haloarculaceae archaeon H-GB2-1]|nr:hypothetical protein [Haloarculaceae archaeon H-GB1-1]MEA5386008.1 HTH domain-containing protein [Haloarculaceae archaeon H-GB11]MEA5407512.1 HTH domain-containing protein [Haloarculaceae archaeon H-GB2-1]
MVETPQPRIELYVRSLLPDGAHERQEAVIERLEEMDARGDVEGFSVIVWGKQLARDTAATRTDEGRYILNRVAEFQQWALSNNVSLDSFCQTHAAETEVSDEPKTAITLPVMGLAEYQDGELQHVAPCTKGDSVHTIMDRLKKLEAGLPSVVGTDAGSVRVV